jgi:hypothetical protein
VYSTLPENVPHLKHPLDVSKLPRETWKGTPYYAWRAAEGNSEGVKRGMYLLNDQGQPAVFVDPGINGKLTKTDDGKELKGRLAAPQAELFALITQGILNHRLPWTLVLLGVIIAVVLELCGIGALAFAVGVYLPLSSTTPIFIGGLVRYFVDRAARKKQEGPTSELESEMSPGALFSTGYIAGGTMGGLLIAFLVLADRLVPGLTDKLAIFGDNVPHQTATAMIVFLALAILLFLVGRGWLLKTKDARPG